jgi:hypothetical protein
VVTASNRDAAGTYFHQTCTAKMGRDQYAERYPQGDRAMREAAATLDMDAV